MKNDSTPTADPRFMEIREYRILLIPKNGDESDRRISINVVSDDRKTVYATIVGSDGRSRTLDAEKGESIARFKMRAISRSDEIESHLRRICELEEELQKLKEEKI